ncbi:hypothetical protein FisN_1Hh450 [Fistulifera solaris]|jgi:hypothetical protein|uniref:Agenet domain-containing protein n=1 Tax=Fistulifera solaris TaxID=1519565 RepID=A0A1Z5JJS0_FISSO|nr:hypothetical protein FisN_1Hh450 [Fistulifera solaris]|eukprot:GAX14255.1 hypothetical protein FisN_1Hh450 [Fistulifera solaris]
MASDQTVLNIMGHALWAAKPTPTDLRAQQLAAALGYPAGWRVVRTMEEMEYNETVVRKENEETSPTEMNVASQEAEPGNSQIKKEDVRADEDKGDTVPATEKDSTIKFDVNDNERATSHVDESSKPVQGRKESIARDEPTSTSDIPAVQTQPGRMVKVIVDRIYAGKPGTDCDMWYHHAAATRAALIWMEKEAIHEDPEQSGPAPTPFDFKGGHMLPRSARFDVGDKVEVLYEGEWWDAKILRRNEHKVDGFRYQVFYSSDSSKQSGVAESSIRPRMNDEDPHKTAASNGFDETWQAFSQGGNRWKIIGPDGTVYKSKKAALQAFNNKSDKPSKDSLTEEDPPWRTVGSEYLGKFVRWVTEHKASARRKVAVEQIGEVVGWISETDVDKAGEPGFVSEKTGKPASLYHVVFNDEPTHHPYASVLIEFVDLEEYELKECILSEEEYRPNKKARVG